MPGVSLRARFGHVFAVNPDSRLYIEEPVRNLLFDQRQQVSAAQAAVASQRVS
jgi:hypothetical protein